jgi:putative transposase
MAARSVTLTDEAVRSWCLQCAQAYANQWRRQRPRPGDKWHWDEVILASNGQRYSLWGFDHAVRSDITDSFLV